MYAVPVFATGVTDIVPASDCPPSHEILAEVAFVELQLRATAVPLSGLMLLAVIVQVGATGATVLTSAKYEKCAVSKLTFPLTPEFIIPPFIEVQLIPS